MCRYETFAPQNPARKIASGHEHLIVGGVFEVASKSFHNNLPATPITSGFARCGAKLSAFHSFVQA